MKRNKPILFAVLIAAGCVSVGLAQELAPVASKPVSRTVDLPGEFLAFQTVAIHAKVPGYVERILVDRGSAVKQGDLLAELAAPEMNAQVAEGQSKVQASEAERLQAEAQEDAALAPVSVVRWCQ